jgi:hypothetical protein
MYSVVNLRFLPSEYTFGFKPLRRKSSQHRLFLASYLDLGQTL